jgi:uncharacterized protein YxjI
MVSAPQVTGAQSASFTPTTLTGASTLLNTSDIVMKRKLVSMREHYDIEDRGGRKIGEGEGNFVQVPAKFVVSEVSDSSAKTEVMHIDGKVLSLRHQFTLYDVSGNLLGELKKKLAKLIGQEYWLEVNGTELMRIFGKFTQHQYQMTVNGQQVAEVNRKWVSATGEFGLSITGDVDPRIVIGSAIVIEHLETQGSGLRIN